MIIRGLLIATAGFLFIFSPGLPMGLIARRVPSLNRGLAYWGVGVWLVALLPSLFVQSLLRQAVSGSVNGLASAYLMPLIGALLTAFLLVAGLSLVLRRRRSGADEILPDGIAAGFGVGLIAQIFTGLSLVGAGLSLVFGRPSEAAPGLDQLVEAPMLGLLISLAALVLFRLALLAVSAAVGILAARSIGGGWRFFWMAVMVDAGFAWVILALQSALGSGSPGTVLAGGMDPWTAFVAAAYYLLAFGLAYRWLLKQAASWAPSPAMDKSPGRQRNRAVSAD